MKRAATFAALFVVSLTATRIAHADDTSLETLLSEEVVTSVSKSAETAESAPALTRNISAEEMHRYGISSIDGALDFLGVGVHTEHQLDHAELTVRGVAFAGDRGNHVLILVDGHIINEPLFGDAPIDQRLGVPLELIDHIELVLGPGSSVYGSNAVLAVVNIVTKSASENAGFHVAAEIGALGTQRMTLTTGQQFDLLGKRASFTAGLGYYRRDSSVKLETENLVDPLSGKHYTWGGVANDSNHQDVPGVHMRFVRDRLEIMARATVSNVGDPTGTGDFDHVASGTLQRRASISISQSFPLGKFGDLTATIYGDTFGERQRTVVSRDVACPFNGVMTCNFEQRNYSNRLGADLRANLDWLHDGRLVTNLGASASFDRADGLQNALNYETNQTLLPWTHTVTLDSIFNLAANAQQSWRPFSWLDLTAGGRVDWRKLADDNGDGTGANYVFDPVLTPRLALTLRPWQGTTAKLLYAEAFRAPNPYELDGHSATLIQSQNLQPEHTTDVEAILEQRVGEYRGMFGVFRTEYHGIINRLLLDDADARAAIAAGKTSELYDSNVPLYQYRIDDHVTSQGFNAGIDGAAFQRRLRFGGSFTGTYSRADNDERVSIAPQWFGNARVSYDLGGKLPTLALASTFAGSALTDRAYDAGFARLGFAPPSLEVRGTITGTVPWVKGLSYRAIVKAQTASNSPFAVGPVLRGGSGLDSPALAPTTPWNAIFGLQYDFGR